MNNNSLSFILFLSSALMFSCGKSQSPNGPSVDDTFTISVTVIGADVVTLTVSGDGYASATVNNGKTYTFTSIKNGWTITITPSKTGYTFTPESKTFTKVTANMTQDFVAKKIDTATTTPIAPTNFTATVASSTQINLKWDNNSTNENGFRIERKEGTGTWGEIGTVGAGVKSYSAIGMKSNTQYTFRVRAYNSFGNSIYSNEAGAKTQASGSGGTVIKGIRFASIPGGTFQMGDVENEGRKNEKPVHSVTISGFEIGVYEITNAQYAKFLNDAMATGDITSYGSDYDVDGAKGIYRRQLYILTSNNKNRSIDYPDDRCWIANNNLTFTVEPGKENFPVGYVTWYGAKAFALYYGFDLPTEAEWEYACRGGKQYKYGTTDGTISKSNANATIYGDDFVEVGSFPPNPYGVYDMTGSAVEWVHDFYGLYTSSSQKNPSGPQSGNEKVHRSGFPASDRTSSYLDGATLYNGFRVVHRASPQNY